MDSQHKTKAQLIKENEQLRAELDYFRQKHESCEFNLNKITQDHIILQNILDNNPLSIQILNADGSNRSVNAAHTALFKALPGPDFNLFTDSQLLKLGFAGLLQNLKRGEVVFFPYHTYSPPLNTDEYPDSEVHLNAIGFLVMDTDGQPERYVVIHHDITEIKQTEKKLQQLAAIIQTKVEDERKFIVDELHDHIGQGLTGLKLDLEYIIIKNTSEEEITLLKNIVTKTNNLIKMIQDLSSYIRPVMLVKSDIKAAMEGYLRDFEQMTRMEILTDINNISFIEPDDALIVFRILQEALTNISRHAKASQVEVTMKKVAETYDFIISDNGIGISREQIDSFKSTGLTMMYERAKTIGGDFTIKAKRESGTEIKICLPIKKTK